MDKKTPLPSGSQSPNSSSSPSAESSSQQEFFTNAPYLNRTGYRYCALANPKDAPEATNGWNSVMQLLYVCTPLRRHFISYRLFHPGSVHSAIGHFLEEMQRDASTTAAHLPARSLSTISWIFGSHQQVSGSPAPVDTDVQSFLATLLETSHQELNNGEPIKATFEEPTPDDGWLKHGYIANALQCHIESKNTFVECGHKGRCVNAQWMLSLAVPPQPKATSQQHNSPVLIHEKPSLRDAINLWSNQETLTSIECPKCKVSRTCSTRLSVCQTSRFFLIHFRRIQPDGEQNSIPMEVLPNLEICRQNYDLVASILRRPRLDAPKLGQYCTLVRESTDQWTNLCDEKITKGIRDDDASRMLANWAYLVLYGVKRGKKSGMAKTSLRMRTPKSNPGKVTPENLAAAIQTATLEDDFAKWWITAVEKQKTMPLSKPQDEDDPEESLEDLGLGVARSEPYGYCGLNNLGFSCYANSCLQVLYTTNRIRRYLIENPQAGPMHSSLSNLLLRMETESSRLINPAIPSIAIKPDSFMQQFRAAKSIFTANTMHDAQEFLAILLESVHQEANQAKRADTKTAPKEEPKSSAEAWALHLRHIDNSPLSSLLMGQLESSLRCLTCGRVSRSWTAIWQLQLQLESETNTLSSATFVGSEEKKAQENKVMTFQDCFKEYTEEETLTQDCAPVCPSCKSRQPAAKRQTICRVPHYLLVHVKRFAYDGTKIHCRVALEEHLQLCAKHFVLSSVVLHSGTETFGHYYTLHREKEDTWVQLDDQLITRGLTNKVVFDRLQRHAYLCLYRAVEEPKRGGGKGNEKSASSKKQTDRAARDKAYQKMKLNKGANGSVSRDKTGEKEQQGQLKNVPKEEEDIVFSCVKSE